MYILEKPANLDAQSCATRLHRLDTSVAAVTATCHHIQPAATVPPVTQCCDGRQGVRRAGPTRARARRRIWSGVERNISGRLFIDLRRRDRALLDVGREDRRAEREALGLLDDLLVDVGRLGAEVVLGEAGAKDARI